MELTRNQTAWLERVHAEYGDGNYWMALGWPDEELGLGVSSYLDWLDDQYEDYKYKCEYEEFEVKDFEVFAAEMTPYEEWREKEMERIGDGSDEFSRAPCELCGNNLAGSRHPATLFSYENKEVYTPYIVCQDCLMYLANGDVPDDDYLGMMNETFVGKSEG